MEGTIGEIRMFAGNFAPRSWAFCDGQLIAISSNTALFSIIGTTYGGDGRTTFALPDMRGRIGMHAGTGPGLTPRMLGQRFGVEEYSLSPLQMAAHTHFAQSTLSVNNLTLTIPASTAVGNKKKPTGNILAVDVNDPTTLGSPISVDGTGSITTTINNSGMGQPVQNIQPVEVINYIICQFGVYPSRS